MKTGAIAGGSTIAPPTDSANKGILAVAMLVLGIVLTPPVWAEVGLAQVSSTGLTARISPEAGEPGIQNVYMGAVYNGTLYLRGAGTRDWNPDTGGLYPVAGQVNLFGPVTITVTDFDISGLVGLDVYVAYGLAESDIYLPGHLARIYPSASSCTPSGHPRFDVSCTPVAIESVSQSQASGNFSFSSLDSQSQPPGNSSRPSLLLIGTVAPPMSAGVTLQATDSHMDDRKEIIISYAVAGSTQAGALDLINVQNETAPRLSSEIIFPTSDINAVTRSGDQIIMTGASSSLGAAEIKSLRISGGQFDSSSAASFALPSFAGTGIAADRDRVLVSYGNTGGMRLYSDSNLNTPLQAVAQAEARAVAFSKNGYTLFLLTGMSGVLRSHNPAAQALTATAVGGANTAESKSTLEIGNTTATMALGEGGVKISCLADGASLASIPAVTVTGLSSAVTVTNSATMTKGLLFTANGEAGIYVYSVKENNGGGSSCKRMTVTLLGSLALGLRNSANHVRVSNNLLFVANGLGGLKIVRFENAGDGDEYDDD